MKFNLEFGVDLWIIIQTLSLGRVRSDQKNPQKFNLDHFLLMHRIAIFERYLKYLPGTLNNLFSMDDGCFNWMMNQT